MILPPVTAVQGTHPDLVEQGQLPLDFRLRTSYFLLGAPTRTNFRKEKSAVVDKKVITSDKAALPVGPYSQAIQAGDFVFVAGEKGIDPKTGKIVEEGIAAETRQTLENIKAILEAADLTMDHVVRSVVYMTDIGEFAAMNAVYAEYFPTDPPGRSCVQVVALPAGAHVEIEVTAVR